jgi:type I restriction enzyme M protein
MSEEEKRLLQQQLWNIANTLRGKMNADEFRDYILGFIFYKYLSEKLHLYANTLLEEDGIDYANMDESTEEGREMVAVVAEEAVAALGYTLKPSELFGNVAKRGNANVEGGGNFILGDLATILTNIEKSTMGTDSQDDFDNLFEDLDLSSSKLGKTEKQKNELIAKVLAYLDNINFNLKNKKADVLGDAYEYLIGQFASGAGKKAGEFYTPQTVSSILAKLVTRDNGSGKSKGYLKSVYDPTCGSGSLLLRVAREVQEVAHFYGQELNRTTYNLCRMNMILHDVHYQRFDIRQEDTLEHPQHDLDLRFEAIVANPPFSAHWSANPLHMSDDRFSQYGKLAPKTKADFAFVAHMVHHLADNGTLAVVLPHGVLFRGAAEGHIRRHLIEERNLIDAVIGLPANIFYGTTIPTCILVLKKCRTHPKDILFIDASAHFEKGKNQNNLRPKDIDKLMAAYDKRAFEDKYAYVASLEEVAENDYNLNIPRYVDTFEEEEPVDLEAVASKLQQLEQDMKETDATIADFCGQLGIKAPF